MLRWLDALPSQAQQSKRYVKVRISPPHPKHPQVVALNSIMAAKGNVLHSTRHATCARKLDTLPRCVGGGKLDSTPSHPPLSPKHPLKLCSLKHPKRGDHHESTCLLSHNHCPHLPQWICRHGDLAELWCSYLSSWKGSSEVPRRAHEQPPTLQYHLLSFEWD